MRERLPRVDRADVDDRAVAALEHVPADDLRAEEHARLHHPDRGVPVLVGEGLRRARQADARVVDRACRCARGRPGPRPSRPRPTARELTSHCVRGPAQAGGGLGRGGAVEVQDRDGRALGDEPRRDRLPDAPRAAGDHTRSGQPASSIYLRRSGGPLPGAAARTHWCAICYSVAVRNRGRTERRWSCGICYGVNAAGTGPAPRRKPWGRRRHQHPAAVGQRADHDGAAPCRGSSG